MRSSRDVGLLRADVAENCRRLLARAKADGYPVLVTGTVRDAEFQLKCYKNGKSRSKVPVFHAEGVGLAFDVCKNVRGQEYSDAAFWRYVGALGKKMGFTWGGDWKSFVDRPHFQWDGGGAYKTADILAGRLPPEMPPYGEEKTVAEKDNTPAEWEAGAVEWAVENGLLLGDGAGDLKLHSPITRAQFCVLLRRYHERAGELS